MSNKHLIKRSSIVGRAPTITDLDYGELGLNFADGKLYFKDSANAIKSFDSSASDLLTKIKTVDGAGSGLDADLLDGQSGSYYLAASSYTAADVLSKLLTVDGSGSGLDADLLDGQSSSYYAAKTHKDHTFVNNTYYYDQYTQDKYLRIFTENATSDTVRFGAVSNVEYYDFNTSTWVVWTGGDSQIKNMLDGRQETYADIDHTHRKFRFTVTKNSGWPTQVITGIYMSWYGNGWTNIGYTLEDTADNVTFTTKETLTFGSATTGGDYGWHLYATSNLHNGRTLQRITIDITDWVDSGSYTTKRINKIAMFSNYAASDYSMVPLKWDYNRVIKFPVTPQVNNDQIWHAGNDGAGSGLDADTLDGQHGSYYLAASSYTAADVLSKLLTVDGAGSGLDADTLDGIQGSSYVTLTGTQTLANKTLASPTVTGTMTGDVAVFNSVRLSDGTAGTAGTVSWNTDDGTLDLVMAGGTVVQQIGLEQFYSVKNQTGATITNGTPVFVNGVLGASGHVTVAKMIANGTVVSKRFIGLATENIADGDDGFVTSFGYVRGVDASGAAYGQTWSIGDIIYVSQSTAGYLTNVEPTSGLKLAVAVVISNHLSNGILLVRAGPAISATAEQGILADTAIQQQDLETYVATQIANLVDSAPTTLDTLNELAAALGDDPNFATTITSSLGTKVSNTTTVSAGTGLTGGGALSGNITISHDDTSSATNLTASSRTYVTGLTFDTFGHVTGYTTGTETITDTNTTYSISAETATGGVNLRLTGSDSSTDDIKLAAGTNITLTRTDANTITIDASGGSSGITTGKAIAMAMVFG